MVSSTGTLYDRRLRFDNMPSGAAVNIIRDGEILLKRIVVNTPGAGNTIIVYNNNTNSGDIVANIAPASTPSNLEYDVVLDTGLTIDKTGTADITIIYQ